MIKWLNQYRLFVDRIFLFFIWGGGGASSLFAFSFFFSKKTSVNKNDFLLNTFKKKHFYTSQRYICTCSSLKTFILLTIYLTIIVIYSRCILNQLENKYIVILNKFTISIISGNLKPKLKKKNNKHSVSTFSTFEYPWCLCNYLSISSMKKKLPKLNYNLGSMFK